MGSVRPIHPSDSFAEQIRHILHAHHLQHFQKNNNCFSRRSFTATFCTDYDLRFFKMQENAHRLQSKKTRSKLPLKIHGPTEPVPPSRNAPTIPLPEGWAPSVPYITQTASLNKSDTFLHQYMRKQLQNISIIHLHFIRLCGTDPFTLLQRIDWIGHSIETSGYKILGIARIESSNAVTQQRRC